MTVIFLGKNTAIRRADFVERAIDHLNYESTDGRRSARRQISCDRQVDNAGYTRDFIDSTFAQWQGPATAVATGEKGTNHSRLLMRTSSLVRAER